MLSKSLVSAMQSPASSAIRKMFEEGILLKKKFGEKNVFDFSLGNPDLDPPGKVVSAIREVSLDETHGRHGYMPNAGYFETRAAFAKKVSIEQGLSKDCELLPTDVVVTSGAGSAICSVMRALLNAGDYVLVPSPFFSEYKNYALNFSGILRAIPTKDDFSLDFDAINLALNEAGKNAAIFLLNSPNNPTGKIYSCEELTTLCSILKSHAKKTSRAPYLLMDEPYREIVYDGKKVPSVFEKYEWAVVASSFAKNLSLPGERIGYVACNPKNPERETFVSAVTFAFRTLGFVNAPAFFQKVLAKSWDAKADLTSYGERRTLLANVLSEAGIEFFLPEGAFYIFAKVPKNFDGESKNDEKFCEHLKTHNILTAPGSGFGGEGHFRLAFCVSCETIIESKNAFKKAMSFL